MKIRNVLHKGLRRFIEDDDFVGASRRFSDQAARYRHLPAGLQQENELRLVRSWKAHQLTGDRKGTWSLSVTRNWRLTFLIDRTEIEIIDLDYEDYH